MIASEKLGWMERGSCRGKQTALWFPVRSQGTTARAICATCSVQSECLEYALADPLPVDGIWGGTDARQRAVIRRQQHAPRTMTV